ncbi:MAG: MAPEG family protein [Burkholderiaceae bacterium]
MTPNALNLLLATLGMVLLTFAVALRMLYSRVQEMRRNRIHPQAVATSTGMARLENTQAADNFRNLFETPVLFYALVACAIAASYVPPWLVIGAWCYFGLRIVHTIIHCTYNRVMHRLAAFAASFTLLVILWICFVLSLPRGVL